MPTAPNITNEIYKRRRLRVSPTLLVALTLGIASAAHAQDTASTDKGKPPAGDNSVVSGEARTPPPAKNAEAAKATEFVDVGTDPGKAITGPAVKLPAGATRIRQLSAPLENGADTIVLNIYKVNDNLCCDILASHKNQPWTKLNHIVLKAPLTIRPDKMTVNMRYLEATHRHGFLIVASDESEDLTISFPNGFAGAANQQAFMTQSKDGSRHTYSFGDEDSRGYAIVKENLDSTGQVKASADEQFFVWNGKEFIPRKAN